MVLARWLDWSGSSLRGRMALSLTLALLPVGLLAMVQSYQGYRHGRELERLAIFGAAERAVNRAERSLNEASGATRAIGHVLLPVAQAPGEDCPEVLGDLVAGDGRIRFAGFVVPDGRMVCTSRSAAADQVMDPGLLAQLTESGGGALFLDTPYSPDGPAVHITLPVTEAESLAGWMLTIWPTSYFYSDPVGGEISGTSLVDRNGTVFAESSPASVPADIDLKALDSGGRQLFEARSLEGRRMYYAAVPLAGGGLTALAARPTGGLSRVFDDGAYLWTLALPLLMWGISLSVAVLSTNRLATGPLKRLMKMTRAMSHGVRDLSGIRLQDAPAELQNLSDRFIEMSLRVNRYESSLEEALEEKTVLLKEVHHRVRNNLQLLVSVLNMQERSSTSQEVKSAMARFRQRVLGLSAAHEHLYEAELMARRLSGRLVADVVAGALTASGVDQRAARLDIEDVALGQDSAVPLALFTGEAVAEALAFAEVEGGRPELCVTLASVADKRARLEITCRWCELSGTALPDDEFGSRLMRALAGQLGGRHRRSVKDGTYRAELTFATGAD
jgi:two-component system, sensor histidine kinase PdtaS